MALNIIHRARSKDCVVFLDSLSSLQAIDSCRIDNPLILKILKDHNQLTNSGTVNLLFSVGFPATLVSAEMKMLTLLLRQDWMFPSPA